MRRIFIAFLASISLVALPAYADRGYHGGRAYSGHGHHRHHGHGGAIWPGVAVVGALTGLALLSQRPVYAAPYYAEPVYVAPPLYRAPPVAASTWYYCQSSAMYYPYTRACPEGWQRVPAQAY